MIQNYADTSWVQGLSARRGGALPEIQPDGTVRLQGEREWLFAGAADHIQRLIEFLPGAERLSESLALLSFGNSVGVFAIPGMGRIEVISGKWDSRHYDRMLSDLTDVAVGLPFTSGENAALPYDRSVAAREDVLYHAFVYLRHVLLGSAGREQRLLAALELILRDPHRRFKQTTRFVPVARARHVDVRSLDRLVAGTIARVPTTAADGIPLARALRGHLPETVEERTVVASHDTPENRFVLAFLRFTQGVIDGMRSVAASSKSGFGKRVLSDCDQMDRLLRPIRQHALWHDVGPMVHVPAGSTVLQRRRGYREVFGHWVRLRLATRLPLTRERVRDLLEVKDIAELYELWCFYSLIRSIQSVLGPPRSVQRPVATEMHVMIPWDLAVEWPDGTRALYNPRFSRSRTGARNSYSVPLRPDIAIHIPDGPNEGLHLFDAKFKVDAIQGMVEAGDDESPDDSTEERRGRFKRGDIYKMHAYRDALPSARSVWILYPGTEFTFYSANGSLKASSPIQVQGMVEGVGAVPHLPADTDAPSLTTLLSQLFAPAGATTS